MKIYSVFYILLLESIRNPENKDDKVDDEEYEIEKILKRKLEKGWIYYLIK